MKCDIEKLKKLSFEDVEQYLISMGYSQSDGGRSESNISDYVEDCYYVLFDDDGEEIDRVSYVMFLNRVDDDRNDDGTLDIIVKEYWERILETL